MMRAPDAYYNGPYNQQGGGPWPHPQYPAADEREMYPGGFGGGRGVLPGEMDFGRKPRFPEVDPEYGMPRPPDFPPRQQPAPWKHRNRYAPSPFYQRRFNRYAPMMPDGGGSIRGGGMGQVIPTNIPFRDQGYGSPMLSQNLIQSLSGPNNLMNPYRRDTTLDMLSRFGRGGGGGWGGMPHDPYYGRWGGGGGAKGGRGGGEYPGPIDWQNRDPRQPPPYYPENGAPPPETENGAPPPENGTPPPENGTPPPENGTPPPGNEAPPSGFEYFDSPVAGEEPVLRPSDARYGVGHGGLPLTQRDVEYLAGKGVPVQSDGSIAEADFIAWANKSKAPGPIVKHPGFNEWLNRGSGSFEDWLKTQPQYADSHGRGVNLEAWNAGADTDGNGLVSAEELAAYQAAQAAAAETPLPASAGETPDQLAAETPIPDAGDQGTDPANPYNYPPAMVAALQAAGIDPATFDPSNLGNLGAGLGGMFARGGHVGAPMRKPPPIERRNLPADLARLQARAENLGRRPPPNLRRVLDQLDSRRV